METVELSTILRRRIVADLHLGRLKPGSRLPSLRTVARELDVSIRAAARAYAELEQEGLVTVRGRSGIYLVLPPAVEIDLEEPLDWYADMLRDAWVRRLTVADVMRLLQQLVETPMRVACVESTTDHMVAFCSEMEDDFALKTMSVKLTSNGAEVDGQTMTLYDALSQVDFAVTTAFHAAEVRDAADLLKKPVVVVSVNETLVAALENQLLSGPITIVAEDPRFVDRFQTYLIERFRESGDMRIAVMDDVLKDPEIASGTTALYSRAARQRLQEPEYHLLPPPIPFISANAARRIVQCMLSTHRKRVLQTA
jgi:GntR family transcriptional regulator